MTMHADPVQPFWSGARLVRVLFVGVMNTGMGYSLYATIPVLVTRSFVLNRRFVCRS